MEEAEFIWPSLDWLTAVGTVAAALAAVAAIIVSAALVARDRKRAVLRDRLAEAVELLSTFEQLYSLPVHAPSRPTDQHREIVRLQARFRAQLWASAELVPITRANMLRHLPFGSDDRLEAQHYSAAEAVGNPELDEEVDRKMRAELIQAIAELRGKLSGEGVDLIRKWKGRPLSD